MRIRYDEKNDVLYIRLREEKYYESDEIKTGFIIDYDKKGNIVGIEILDVSGYLSAEELYSLHFDFEKVLSKRE